MSLDQLSQLTKISASLLEALENDEVDKLPSGFYTRAFIRTYASEVGLDPEIIVSHYLNQFEPESSIEPAEQAVVEASERRREAPIAMPIVDQLSFQFGAFSPRVLIAAAVVVAAIAYLMYPRQNSSTQEVSAAEPTVAQASLAPTPISDPAKTAIPPPGQVIRFDIKPGGPCWVQVTSDGRPVLSRLLQSGERETIEMRDEMVLRIGDPGVFGYSIDGITGRPLGNAGQPVTVKITRDNYREFLAS